MPVAQQVISIYAVTSGAMDDIPAPDVKRFQQDLLAFLGVQHPEVAEDLESTGQLPDELAQKLAAAIAEFKKSFVTSEGKGAGSEEPAPNRSPRKSRSGLAKFRRPTPEEMRQKAGSAAEAPGGTQLPG